MTREGIDCHRKVAHGGRRSWGRIIFISLMILPPALLHLFKFHIQGERWPSIALGVLFLFYWWLSIDSELRKGR